MNLAVANGLLMVVAKFVLWPKKKTTKCFTIYCVSKVMLRYLPLYLG